jgi:hypothetical protein
MGKITKASLEIDDIYDLVLAQIPLGDGAHTLKVNFYAKYNSQENIKNMLVARFKEEHITFIHITVINTDIWEESIPPCIITNIFCVCIPLLYWIPYYLSKYTRGEPHVVKISF